jgi:seryl-tRNA synthetase
MARKQEVSLFPFLDILACVIGNLILIITTVVLEQVDTKPVAEAARIEQDKEDTERSLEEKERLEKELAQIESQLEERDSRIKEARRRLEEARAERSAAASKLREAPKDMPALDPKLAEEAKRLAEEAKKAAEEVEKLEAELAALSTPPEQAIKLLPAGEIEGQKAVRGVFVEVTPEGLVLHDGEKPHPVAKAAIGSDKRFKELLAKAKADEFAIVTFLVRPESLEVLTAAQNVARAAGARAGRVPLPGDGVLDLTAAKPAAPGPAEAP